MNQKIVFRNFFGKIFLILFLFLESLEFALSQKDDSQLIMIDLDKKEITVGSILTVAVKLFLPKGASVTSWKEKLSEKWTLKNFTSYKQKQLDGEKVFFRYDYNLTSYETGSLSIGYFSFDIQWPDGRKKVLKSENLKIDVVSVIKNKKVPLDIDEITSFLPPQNISWKYFFFILFFLIFLFFLAYFGVKKYNIQKRKLPSKIILIPEDQEAFNALNRINFSLFKAQKEFYEEVSSILKRYLNRRFEFSAQESTSAEIISAIKNHVPRDILNAVRDFTQDSDLVKFAKKETDKETILKVVSKIKWIIEQTKKTEVCKDV